MKRHMLWILACGVVVGCAPPAPQVSQATADHDRDHDHDHDDQPAAKTVAEAVAQLEKLLAEAKAHLTAGEFEKADGPVHSIGHVLEGLGDLVAKEKPAAEAEARKAADAIFTCFDKIDTVIHSADEEARKKLDLAEHAPAIESALATLKKLVP